MDQAWLAEEVRLFNRVFTHRTVTALGYTQRRISRLPRGKYRSELQKMLDKNRATQFAREWQALDELLANKP